MRHDGSDTRVQRAEPGDKKQVMEATKVPGVLAVMATAGLYDVRAQRAITDISNALGGNPYAVKSAR